MPKYLVTVHSGPADPEGPMSSPSEEEMAAMMARKEQLEAELRKSGAWSFSARLTDPGSATVVRRRDGETLLTDGPYLESKEHMAGFYLIDAADLDEALGWTEKFLDTFGMPALEVRALADWEA